MTSLYTACPLPLIGHQRRKKPQVRVWSGVFKGSSTVGAYQDKLHQIAALDQHVHRSIAISLAHCGLELAHVVDLDVADGQDHIALAQAGARTSIRRGFHAHATLDLQFAFLRLGQIHHRQAQGLHRAGGLGRFAAARSRPAGGLLGLQLGDGDVQVAVLATANTVMALRVPGFVLPT